MFERAKSLYERIDTWVCVWKLVSAILLCTGRYFLTPASYKPLAAYPTTLAQLMPIIHWLLMGAFIFSARRQNHPTQTTGLPLVDKDEPEAEVAELEEVNREVAGILPEGDETVAKDQPQARRQARRQEELRLVMEILIHGIKLRDPQSWSRLEQLLVSSWEAAL